MSNLLNNFSWKDYGVKHGLYSDSKCVEHAIQASVVNDSKAPSIFDWKRYIKEHPDLQRTFGKGGPVHVNDATCHYLSHGIKEGRKKYILGTVAAPISSVLLNYCTVRYLFNIDIDGLLFAITLLTISTFLFFAAEVLTAILLVNNRFKQISFAWSLSTFTLIVGIVIVPISLKTISANIFLSAICLILGFGKNLRDLDPRRR